MKWDLFPFSSSVAFPLPAPLMMPDLLPFGIAKEIGWSKKIWRQGDVEDEKDEETQRLE